MIYLRLFYEFFKTGLFAVGGGLATLPFLSQIADETGWYTHSQLADMIAVSESSPGPIGVNMATYVGFTCAGIPGAVIATLGLIAPSIIIILMIAAFLERFKESKYVSSAFYGLRPASTGLIAAAGLSVAVETLMRLEVFSASKNLLSLFDWKYIVLAAILLILTRWCKPTKNLHPILFILASAVVGIVFAGV